VGAVVTAPPGRLLLIKRGRDPEAGRWSLPGGRIEPGETDEQALVREVAEETGLWVVPGQLVGAVERTSTGGTVLEIRDYAAAVTGGRLAPGDDAADARWVTPAGFAGLPLTSGLARALTGWGVLAAAAPPALAAEAASRAGLIWLAIEGQDRPRAAWHLWRPAATGEGAPGSAYVVTGPGEQPLPGLASAAEVMVTVAGKDSGGPLVTWPARVHRVAPGSPEWAAVIGPLLSRRLNITQAAGQEAPARRWARAAAVFGLTPVTRPGPVFRHLPVFRPAATPR
jgi:8-oxo-dGTP diphosphatase